LPFKDQNPLRTGLISVTEFSWTVRNFLNFFARQFAVRINMSDIRNYFASTTPAPHPGGRPTSGAGSRGGLTGHNRRDSESRPLNKRARSQATRSDSDEEEKQRKQHAAKRVNWSKSPDRQRLENALELVQRGKGVTAAARESGVPKTVVLRRSTGSLTVFSHAGNPTSLSTQQELELKTFLLEMADRGFGKDVGEISHIAIRLCKNKNFKATPKW
jgi:hypothetical protein